MLLLLHLDGGVGAAVGIGLGVEALVDDLVEEVLLGQGEVGVGVVL